MITSASLYHSTIFLTFTNTVLVSFPTSLVNDLYQLRHRYYIIISTWILDQIVCNHINFLSPYWWRKKQISNPLLAFSMEPNKVTLGIVHYTYPCDILLLRTYQISYCFNLQIKSILNCVLSEYIILCYFCSSYYTIRTIFNTTKLS